MRYVLALAAALLGCGGDDPHEAVACDPQWGAVLGMPIAECDAACAVHPGFSTDACAFTREDGIQRSCATGPQATFDGETGCCVVASADRVRWYECE